MRYIISLSVLIFLFSCTSEEKKQAATIPKNEFDKLENVLPTANWKMIDGNDTSYFYFSRLGDINYNVYHYKIAKGDSSIVEESFINYINNTICWIHPADTLKLASLDSVSAVWHTLKDDKPMYAFKRLSDSTMSVLFPDEKQVTLKRTLPLATFLVRSKYDYINNTHTVDSPLVPHRGKDLP